MNNKIILFCLIVLIGCGTKEKNYKDDVITLSIEKHLSENETKFTEIARLYQCSNQDKGYLEVLTDSWKVYELRKKVLGNDKINFNAKRIDLKKYYDSLVNLSVKYNCKPNAIMQSADMDNLTFMLFILSIETDIMNEMGHKIHCIKDL